MVFSVEEIQNCDYTKSDKRLQNYTKKIFLRKVLEKIFKISIIIIKE